MVLLGILRHQYPGQGLELAAALKGISASLLTSKGTRLVNINVKQAVFVEMT